MWGYCASCKKARDDDATKVVRISLEERVLRRERVGRGGEEKREEWKSSPHWNPTECTRMGDFMPDPRKCRAQFLRTLN